MHDTFGVVDGLPPGRLYRLSIAAVNAAREGEAATVEGVRISGTLPAAQ